MKKLLIIILLMVVTTAGCSKTIDYFAFLPAKQTNNSIYLYYDYEYSIVTYDPEKKVLEDPEYLYSDKKNNYFQYSFHPANNYFTTGHSYQSQFKIILIENNQIQVVFNCPEYMELFPLAAKDGYHVYLQYLNNEQKELIEINVIRFDDQWNQLIYKYIKGNVSSGVILADLLFYSVYETDLDQYSVYSIPLEDLGGKPQLIKSKQEFGDLYEYKGKLVTVEKNKLMIGDKEYPRKKHNTFYSEYGLLMQIDINSKNQVFLELWDLEENEIIKSIPGYYGYRIVNGIMYLYSEGNLETLVLD